MRALPSQLLAAALACAIVAPAPAFAQGAQKQVDKKKAAKQYVDAGLAAEGSGDYDTAITMYQKAFELIPHPLLLFDIANAEREGGHTAEALDYYQRYLTADPKGDKAHAAQERVAEIQKQQADAAAADAKAKADADAVARARADADAKAKADADAKAKADADAKAKARADADAKAKADAATHAPPAPAPAHPGHHGWSGMRIAGVVAGGIGVIAAGGGVYFGMQAKSISDQLSKPGAQYDPAKFKDGQADNTDMFIGYGAGAALIATGAILFVLGADHHVAPLVDDHGGGVTVEGRF